MRRGFGYRTRRKTRVFGTLPRWVSPGEGRVVQRAGVRPESSDSSMAAAGATSGSPPGSNETPDAARSPADGDSQAASVAGMNSEIKHKLFRPALEGWGKDLKDRFGREFENFSDQDIWDFLVGAGGVRADGTPWEAGVYLVGADVTQAFHDQNGVRLLFRDLNNNAGRGGKGNHRRFLNKTKKRGLLTKLRWVPICYAEKGTNRILFVAGATLMESCFFGFDEPSLHPNLIAARRNGFPHCLQVHQDTPADVLKWLKAAANDFHEGSEYTIIEALLDTRQVTTGWIEYCKPKPDGIPATGEEPRGALTRETLCGTKENSYDGRRRKWITDNFPTQWSSPHMEDVADKNLKDLERMGLWRATEYFFLEFMDHLEPKFSITVGLQNLAKMIEVVLDKQSIFPRCFSQEARSLGMSDLRMRKGAWRGQSQNESALSVGDSQDMVFG